MSQSLGGFEKLIYSGSVKNIYESASQKDALEFEFTDAYSVFDWGRMPDAIPGKGESLALIAEYFFIALEDTSRWKKIFQNAEALELKNHVQGIAGLSAALENAENVLCSKGLFHHLLPPAHDEKTSSRRIRVRRCAVPKLKVVEWFSGSLYEYPRTLESGLSFLPLEIVFRLGVLPSSSVHERPLQALKKAGFTGEKLSTTQRFSTPLIEYFTKLEPTDRYLSPEEALAVSALSAPAFQKLWCLNALTALFLKAEFERAGLELWDGKLEWAFDSKSNEFVLVDAIGPDELRVMDKSGKTQFSKEFLREYYRKTPWYKELVKFKTEQAAAQGWQKEAALQIGEPPKLSSEYLELAIKRYSDLCRAVTGRTSKC